MSLKEILTAVGNLSPSERAQVAEVLSRLKRLDNDETVNDRQHKLHLRLIAEGRLQGIPDRNLRDRSFKPIKIKGKPLSETIIEERR